MSKLPPFVWKEIVPNLYKCAWQGLILHAGCSGAWWVERGIYADNAVELASYEDQTTGSDLEDAKRRAQGAAIALRNPLVNAEN
jgi:hypothetical protein